MPRRENCRAHRSLPLRRERPAALPGPSRRCLETGFAANNAGVQLGPCTPMVTKLLVTTYVIMSLVRRPSAFYFCIVLVLWLTQRLPAQSPYRAFEGKIVRNIQFDPP